MFWNDKTPTSPVRQPPRKASDESTICADDVEAARIEAKRKRFQQIDAERAKLYSGSPKEKREFQQKTFEDLRERAKLSSETRKSTAQAEPPSPIRGADISTQRQYVDSVRQAQRREAELSLREQNKRLAEERRMAKQKEKESDAKYVATSEAFFDTFGKSLK
ncbi:uncharacterized protein MONOS_7780 [Monocercomonoides exilis]|uniref:uncharacterized protein n=1 Tax=Monocercomonoides exilis TaxID=2049356 RepID=UPI003559CAC6|nr:hypothetical protein MONOS_7780 [Monocercomonoides exilis]|eukprot:MONOS_7780.1-p1 / transcript=MONOS_7780.1 / gene=MONOS_7780 / organism=Monocercomonoides_exilis_PA203 / gene_product=unspecified product / transcript_product=unspecified product / location=Mono_scaffold00274:71479-72141(-) / protein_length=163 / sequence_SO=supercontig / SO=protein_coding / is_pseudo=false